MALTTYTDKGALLSACGDFRYTLWRGWDDVSPPHIALFLMTNPSTADGLQPDPTLTRCVAFAKGWGCTGLVIGNLQAYRTAYPQALAERAKAGLDTQGPANPFILEKLLRSPEVALVLAAWGAHENNAAHATAVLALASAAGRQVMCLGRTADGAPKHPLARGKSFVPYSQQPLPFNVTLTPGAP